MYTGRPAGLDRRLGLNFSLRLKALPKSQRDDPIIARHFSAGSPRESERPGRLNAPLEKAHFVEASRRGRIPLSKNTDGAIAATVAPPVRVRASGISADLRRGFPAAGQQIRPRLPARPCATGFSPTHRSSAGNEAG
jgi:hypothetical protein